MTKKINSKKKHTDDYVASKAKEFDDIKNKQYVTDTLGLFEDEGLPNPFDVVREFIIEKGLKLYGGQALHEHLSKKGKPIYDKYEFPDYDVFSPDAWNHAKELSDRLFKLGFFFVETKASIINDKKHQTYKVSVDLIYVLDLTQIGCNATQLEQGDCVDCGLTLEKQCFSLFNNIPAIDILSNDSKEYTESYDYKKKTGILKNKLLVCSPNWLKISMYLEMSQPYQDPSRLEKVYNRLRLFEEEFKYDLCELPENFLELDSKLLSFYENADIKKLMMYVEKYIDKSKLAHYGSSAYNFYIKGHKYTSEPVLNYEVYTNEVPDEFYLDLLEKLNVEFTDSNKKKSKSKSKSQTPSKSKSKFKFKLVPRIMYWKDIDADNYDIMFSYNNSDYKQLITFTKTYECVPYVQYKNTRYASFDRIKYNYYRGAVLPDIIEVSQPYPRKYKCLLRNLLDIETKLKKQQKSTILSGKYQPFRKECIGGDINKLMDNLYSNFGRNVRMSKKTKLYLDTPKKGLITKIYPAEKDLANVYRPAETKNKFYNKQIIIKDSQSNKFSNKRKIHSLHKLRQNIHRKSNKQHKLNKHRKSKKRKLTQREIDIRISNELLRF